MDRHGFRLLQDHLRKQNCVTHAFLKLNLPRILKQTRVESENQRHQMLLEERAAKARKERERDEVYEREFMTANFANSPQSVTSLITLDDNSQVETLKREGAEKGSTSRAYVDHETSVQTAAIEFL